jgi:hypothetical protein
VRLAAWRRAPFVVVVVLAAATTAGLRALGVAVRRWQCRADRGDLRVAQPSAPPRTAPAAG